MGVFISAIGLATAQGSSADISNSASLQPTEQWPWPVNEWSASRSCRPALGVGSNLKGLDRWRALVQLALIDCFSDQPLSLKTPLFIGSCNGSADDFNAESWSESFNSVALLEGTAWASQQLPVFSSSCNSGLHALYAAGQVLMSGQADEVVVLAADILSRSNHDNFEGLRVLADSPTRPWHASNLGFLLGEAAVALKLVRSREGMTSTSLTGPVLANELTRDDGLASVLESFSKVQPQLILGQGTGPLANDESELAAFQRVFPSHVPLASSLVHFGHTLGASGLLAIALAALLQRNPTAFPALVMPGEYASDGRPLNTKKATSMIDHANETGKVIVTCRALNGSCAAASVGSWNHDDRQDKPPEQDSIAKPIWQTPEVSGPLMNVVLRQLVNEAPRHRPVYPPDVLLVHLETPIAPPVEARIGGRLLPSAVIEMTPGFVSQLVARSWGFSGPALCLVGETKVSHATRNFIEALNDAGLVVANVHLNGTGDTREILWNSGTAGDA